MALATIDARGLPCVRTVLLKQIDARGFHFVTQAHGPKAAQIAKQPVVELCLNWMSHRVQIRARGRAIPMPDAEVESLWAARQRDAQILYHLGIPQSQPIPSYRWLLTRMREARKQWRGIDPIPRSPAYIGFIVRPVAIEFLHHTESRLNRRECFVRGNNQRWTRKILAP